MWANIIWSASTQIRATAAIVQHGMAVPIQAPKLFRFKLKIVVAGDLEGPRPHLGIPASFQFVFKHKLKARFL